MVALAVNVLLIVMVAAAIAKLLGHHFCPTKTRLFQCSQCGGDVRHVRSVMRVHEWTPTEVYEVPDDLAIPTCERCGEAYLSGDMYDAIKAAGKRFDVMRPLSSEIVVSPNRCGGQPVIFGTRITVRTIQSVGAEQARALYPILTEDQIAAAIAYQLPKDDGDAAVDGGSR